MKGFRFGGGAAGIGMAIAGSLVARAIENKIRDDLFQKTFDRQANRTRSDTEESSSEEEKRKLKDVVVIGCGASGIAALAKLQEAGLDVVGLEAADKIGGRICTTEFAGGVVDLGAAWCHGEADNVVYELASRHQLLGRPDGEEEEWFVFSDGTLMPSGNAKNIMEQISKTLQNADKNNLTSISECIRGVRTIGSPNSPIKVPITDPFLEWYERNMHLGGQDDGRQGKSLKGLDEHRPCAGEFWLHWKGKGYKTILDVLLNKPPYSSSPITPKIETRKEVSSIRWQLEDDDDEKKPYVEVTCTDGTKYETKTVIVTVSIGVLKERHQRIFTPALPSEKVKSINNLEFCVLDKIYIEFATKWWPKSPASFNIIWKEEKKRQFSASDKWITEIYGLRTVEGEPRVLLAWIYGKGAKQMEDKSESEVRAGVARLMDEIFSLNFEVSRILSIKRSQWANNKLIRGAYSYRSVNTETGGGSASDLATPLRHKGMSVVYFAGEAASRTHHNSVHGAIETGRLAANNIICTLPRN